MADLFVVVGLTKECAGYKGSDCVAFAHGLFFDLGEAQGYARDLPQDFRPHTVRIEGPMASLTQEAATNPPESHSPASGHP
jgi:hypothetical protein